MKIPLLKGHSSQSNSQNIPTDSPLSSASSLSSEKSARGQRSVHEKIRLITMIGVIFFTLLTGGVLVFSGLVYQSTQHTMAGNDALHEINMFKVNVYEITLAAMDTIVDKEEKIIHPDRIEIISKSITSSQKILDKLKGEFADHSKDNLSEVSASLDRIHPLLAKLNKLVSIDLPVAIAAENNDAMLAEIDDQADESAEKIFVEINKISDILEKNQDDLHQTMTRLVYALMATGLLVLVASIALILYFSRNIKDSIIGPFVGVTQKISSQTFHAVDQLKLNAQQLDSISNRVFEEAQKGAEKAATVSRSIQNVSSATEELASSIEEIRRQSTLSAEVSSLAVKESENMSVMINKLNESSQGISNITELINKIAESTNLLALNATIEAARAGDSGKGFAVVATEVKNLAVKTAEATGDISERVNAMQQMAHSAVAAIENIRETIKEISVASASVMGAVNEQSHATQDISSILHDVMKGVNNTVDMVNRIDRAMEETRGIATQVLKSTDGMANLVQTSDQEIETFLHGYERRNGQGRKRISGTA